MKIRAPEHVATCLLRYVLARLPDATVIDDVVAAEIAVLAFHVLRGSTCPSCGAVLGCNIDCPLCMLASRWESARPASTDDLQ